MTATDWQRIDGSETIDIRVKNTLSPSVNWSFDFERTKGRAGTERVLAGDGHFVQQRQ